jgi:hypothetical protein
VLPLLLALTACAGNALLPESERVSLQNELTSHARYLKVSFYVTPFFRSDSAWLLTDRSPDETDYLERNDGMPILPGEPLGILPAGTLLRIEDISWPTGLTVAGRELMTPRENPWVYLRPVEPSTPAARLSQGRPFILVLRPDLRTRDEALTEIDRFLSQQDPTPELRNLPMAIVDAVEHKDLAAGMAPEQVQQAWGYPERIHIDTPKHTQYWTWPKGTQKAWFENEILVKWEDHGKTTGSTSPVQTGPGAP